MLKNAYWLENIGANTAENERHFAEPRRLPPAAAGRGGAPDGSSCAMPLSFLAAERIQD